MHYLKVTREFVSSTFIYPNDEIVDEDFRQLLQIFYVYGFHQPVPSLKRTIFGLIVLLFGAITYFLGFLKDLLTSLHENDLRRIMVNVPYTTLVFTFVTQAITILMRESQIVQMFNGFQSMHEREDNSLLNNYRRKCCQLVKFYIAYLEVTGAFVLCLNLCGYRTFKLLVPSLYDDFAEGHLLYPLLFLNTVHAFSLLPLIVCCDLIHIVCIVRAGANLKLLSNKLRRCTDSGNIKENEKKLIACIKYHQRILK